MMQFQVGILGAGPAGLVTALALERYAAGVVEVTLLDRNESETDYPGVEYGIQERACRALQRIGIKEEALRRGQGNTEIAFILARGERLQSVVKTDAEWCFCVNRQEFLGDLASLLERTVVRRRALVEAVEPGENGRVVARWNDGSSQQRKEASFDCLIAADGVRSVVRRALFPHFARTHDRGFSCLYFLVEASAHPPPHFRALANGGRSELIMGKCSTATLFPMGRDRLAIGIAFDHKTRSRLWTEQGATPGQEWRTLAVGQKRAIARRLAADIPVHDGLLARLFESWVPDWGSYKIYLWTIEDSDPLPTPYSTTSNVVVIGDAAHAFSPTIGMGASLAIEDAEMIAARIADVVRRHPESGVRRRALRAEAFVPFAQQRFPVWQDLMDRARWATKNFVRQAERQRFAVAPQVPGYLPSRLTGAWEWAIEKMSALPAASGEGIMKRKSGLRG